MTNDAKNARSGRGLSAILAPAAEMTIATAHDRIGDILEAVVAHEAGTRTRAIAAELAAAQDEIRTLRDRIDEQERALAQRDAEAAAMAEQLQAERAANRRRLSAIAQIAAEGMADAAGLGSPDTAFGLDPAPEVGPVHEPDDRMPQPEEASSSAPAAARSGEESTTTGARRLRRAPSASASPPPSSAEADATRPTDVGDARGEGTTVALPADVANACAPLIADGVYPDLDTLVVAALRQFLAGPPCSASLDADGPDGPDPVSGQPRVARSPGTPGGREPRRIGPSAMRRMRSGEVPVARATLTGHSP